ncbi:hypothetical protein VPSG_00040 [Vibrio phage pYD38-B]|uniref:hypothetical protein n=1 Tax=Vibrio phage pYD38-B TaxID=929835 RepID=UPI00034265D4|nr:hypothetical protein VPSG_00040 [Vibrio phage pYD38-B]AGN34359.1 hypothetical protein VPSG_00040 [Vibrio phage pYD38-B]
MNKTFCQLQLLAGLSNSDLAKWLDVTPRQVTRWRSGESAVPTAVFKCLESKINNEVVK